jgi:ankyrin repeat domain-containing protein 50
VHARGSSNPEEYFLDLSVPFYQKSPVREAWLKTYWAAMGVNMERRDMERRDSFSLLHIASYFGIVPLTQKLLPRKDWMSILKRHNHVDKRDSYGNTPLLYAVSIRHEAVVRRLLGNGADVAAKNDEGWTVLQGAAYRGRETVLQQLLERGGVDVDSKDNSGRTLLW